MSSSENENLKPLDAATLKEMTNRFESNPQRRLALNAVTTMGIDSAAHNYDRSRLLQRRFSVTVKQGKVTNQKRSGRCWLFSSLNVARFIAKREMGISQQDFEFSQSYAMYYDKLERANYFLRDMADIIRSGESIDSRLVQYQLETVMGDGGQWTMALNVYKKYGVVPKDFFPETISSENSSALDTQLRHVMHAEVCRLFAAHEAGNDAQMEQIIAEGVERAHAVLTVCLGEPPTSFDWEYTDDQGVFHRVGTITPVEFWKKFVGPAHLEDYVCLVNDPRQEHPRGHKIAIEHLGNVAGGDPTEYLNVDISVMKDCARRILSEKKIPVWFGADCGPFMDRKTGAWATDLFDYPSLFGFDNGLNKEQRVRFGDSAMNHAMAFVGVDVADDGTTTRRWRVENSWGEDIADKGYFCMDDPWFDQYVFEVAVPKSLLPADLIAGLSQPAIKLPAWDPMGALA
jgi:bleomycin hydrolase